AVLLVAPDRRAVPLDEADLVEAVDQHVLDERVELEPVGEALAADLLRAHVDLEARGRLLVGEVDEVLDLRRRELDRQDPGLERVGAEDVAEARRDHGAEAGVADRPRRVLARRPAAEVRAGDQHRRAVKTGLVEEEVRFAAPVEEQERAVAGALDPLQELLRDDLVGVDVGAVERRHRPGHLLDRLHRHTSSRTSTRWPVIAAAAAIGGLIRCVRPPAPCRPSKLRLEVEAQRSPGARMSGFMPRHIEQPALRHSNPALLKRRSRPSSSAARFTDVEPGTTSARTFGCTCRPWMTAAAARRSSSRALVHDPMNTRSIAMSAIAVPGWRSM